MHLRAPIHVSPTDQASACEGLTLAPRGACPQPGGVSEWLRITLAVDNDDDNEASTWDARVRDMYVSVVTEQDQVPWVAPVCGAHVWFGEPTQHAGLWVLELSVDLIDALGGLPSEPYHVHVATHGWASESQRREPATAEPVSSAVPQGTNALTDTLSRLILAYSVASRREPELALRYLEAALEDPAAQRELSRPHQYNAACAAGAWAATSDDPANREALLMRARHWLAQDAALTEAALLAVWRGLGSALAPAERERLIVRRDALCAHQDGRVTDPDLALVFGA